jgi:hypothetical protein
VDVTTKAGGESGTIIPDYTFLVDLDGRRELLFLELVRRTAVIVPVGEASLLRSLKWKLHRYEVFERHFRGHHMVQRLEQAFGRIAGMRALVVTSRGEAQLRSLLAAAPRRHDDLLLFSAREHLRPPINAFRNMCWRTSTGKTRALLAPKDRREVR